jgi:predicted transcriptional regulator
VDSRRRFRAGTDSRGAMDGDSWSMQVKELMTIDVTTVRSTTPIKEAAALLAEHRISGLPVVDADRHVLGVLSERDIIELAGKTAGEAMSAPALTIGANRSVTEAVATMLDRNVKRLPVVDGEGRLVGIVTRADLVRAFVRPDEDVAREIREDVIQRTLWIEPAEVRVEVSDGEVRLSGEVDSKSDAELIPRFVERVPGVTSVLSKLRWRAA